MVYRHDGLITTALVLIAAMATGCSERATPPAPEAPVSYTKQFVPMPFPDDEDGVGETSAPAIAPLGPVSFADGEAAYHARNYTEAAQLFARYVEQRPENAWGHFMLGLSAWKGGDLGRAEEAFQEALRISPNHVKSLVNSSRALLDGNRPGDALDRLARAAELEPASNEVHRLLGRAYYALGRTDDAVDAYRRAIALDAQDSWAMNNLGLLFLEQGRAADALPLLARAVELRKDIPIFQNNLGMALEHTGHFPAAAAAYSGAVASDPDYEKARRNLARVEQVKGHAGEEPFDLEATARRAAEETETSHNQTTARR